MNGSGRWLSISGFFLLTQVECKRIYKIRMCWAETMTIYWPFETSRQKTRKRVRFLRRGEKQKIRNRDRPWMPRSLAQIGIRGVTSQICNIRSLYVSVFVVSIQDDKGITSIPNSQNLTIENSLGFVRPNDPVYASLPPDSRKPPAPIDPSSEF